MAVLQIQAAPFFASKNRAFWNLQLAGWGAAPSPAGSRTGGAPTGNPGIAGPE